MTNTQKIWATLPENYVWALEALAEINQGDSKRKAEIIIDLINFYKTEKEEEFRRNKKYNQIEAAIRGIADYKKVAYIQEQIINNNIIQDYQKALDDLIDDKDNDGIIKLYDEIKSVIKGNTQKTTFINKLKDKIDSITKFVDNFITDEKEKLNIRKDLFIAQEKLDAEAIEKIYSSLFNK